MMKTVCAPLALAALAAPGLAFQDGGDGEQEPVVGPPIWMEPEDEHDHSGDIVQLFHDVETTLREIDLLLMDAGAGEVPLELPEESGLGDLLQHTRKRSDAVIEGIDKILELAGGS